MNQPMHDVEAVVVPRTADLGDGFTVRRALPSATRRTVGPFVFFDQMGPAVIAAGRGLDVRPHPHIGLATVTYLFEGEILHRDSLGTVQPIRAGEVNWMTAGSGIVHSERTPPALRQAGSRLSGLQVWVALPRAHEETAPAFAHHGAHELPLLEDAGTRMRLVLGAMAGARSPVRTLSETLYADVELDADARVRVPVEHAERAVYVVEGTVEVGGDGTAFGAGELLVLRPGAEVVLRAQDASARLVVFGGEPLDGPRHLWWNFVSSSTERILQAADDWRTGRFPKVPDETEFIPLPDKPLPAAVQYP